jgi:Dyp-type peroxidase family
MRISTERGPSFGFLDGISNPVVKGFDKVINPGPSPVEPGVLVTGQRGDPGLAIREAWSVDGSFLSFRWLFQAVPEFDQYLTKNALKKDGNGKVLSAAEGSALLGARMVGRWMSGAPIDVTPFKDDPALATDPKRYIHRLANTPQRLTNLLNRNNDFKFEGEITSSLRCPFAAHVRKTNPRNDLEVPPSGFPVTPIGPHRIMRRGVAFGPEVTAAEKASGQTKHHRGLLFAAYSTSITQGFQLLQQSETFVFLILFLDAD